MTRKAIAQFIAEEFLDETEAENIPNDQNLIDAGVVDSLGLLKIVAFLEEKLNVIIEPELMTPENLNSIQAIFDLVNSASSKQNSQ